MRVHGSTQKGSLWGTERRRTRCLAAETDVVARTDDVLPDSFLEALEHAAQSTKAALDSGANRCLVEILLLGLWDPSSGNLFAEEGDQQRFWKITRKFIEQMSSVCGPCRIKALYPDMGVAAMLRNDWKDRDFEIAAISDKSALAEGDDLVVIAAVDPQGLSEAKRITAEASPSAPVVLFNPRLASGDVGLGLNVRRMRNEFLSTFQITYSLRPISDSGTVFRRFPGKWQVFTEDATSPGRYELAAEFDQQPTGDDLDVLLGSEDDASGQEGQGVLDSTKSALSGFMRFMNSLSK
ncbi:g11726 [Coccomyxa elongata]